MTLKRLPFEYEVEAEGPRATAWGGLPVLAEAMDSLGVTQALRSEVKLGARRKFDAADVVKTLAMTMAAGGDCVDDVAVLRGDLALAEMVDMKFPAPETVRQALDLFHDEALIEAAQAQAEAEALEESKRTGKEVKTKAYVPEESVALRALARATYSLIQTIQKRSPVQVATLDIDATIQESHKREAKPHYQNGVGYQPLIAVWAEHDMVVADEFRDGNVPAHFDALHVVQRAFAAVPEGVTQLRCRADTQMYNTAALSWLIEKGIEFAVGIIKRDGFDNACKATDEKDWRFLEQRSDSQLHVTDLPYVPERMRNVKGLRYLAIRLTPTQGDLIDPERSTRYLGVVTNRSGEAKDILRWYWQKAGTVEHVHDVMKNELGSGVLPSGRFGANAAWYRISALTYNLLSLLKRLGPDYLKNARPKKLRLHVFALPVVLASHARRLMARVSNALTAAINAPAVRLALERYAT